MTDLHKAAKEALWAFQYHVEQTWPTDRATAAIAALRAALAQQDEPKGGGNLPPPLPAEPVQEPVAWRLWDEDPQGGGDWRYYDAKDFKEGIDPMKYFDGLVPLYTTPPKAEPVQEPDLSRCPQCNGPADNGHDRSLPPNPYLCTKCMAEMPQPSYNVTVVDDAHPNGIPLEQWQNKPVQEQDVEDAIEAAYWHFDARKKGLNEWASAPQSERDAFKAEARKLVRGYFPTRQAQETKREMLAVADAFIRGKRAAQEQAEPDHETRAELAEQQVVQLAEERDHYRNLWQKAQQAEPAQEPVAWIDALKDAFFEGFTSVATYNDTLLNSPEEAWENYKPPRAAPPQRKPLTDEEIFAIENDIPDDVVSDRHWTIWYARAIEKAHGIGEQP